MDFEFQNGTGPMDARSPFAQISQNSQRLNANMNSPSKRSAFHAANDRSAGHELIAATTGTNNSFDSPSKSRTMGGQQSSPSKPLPATPAWSTGLFNTPRKPRDEIDDSSAGETPKSPERDDSDATPEIRDSRSQGSRRGQANTQVVSGAERPTSSRRGSGFIGMWATKVKKMYSPGKHIAGRISEALANVVDQVSGRGEVARSDHAGGIEKSKSISKRRKREVDRRVARQRRNSISDSGDDTLDNVHSSP